MGKTSIVLLALTLLSLLLIAGCGEKAGEAYRMARTPSRTAVAQPQVIPIAEVQCQARAATYCDGNISITRNIAADCTEQMTSNPCEFGCMNGVCSAPPAPMPVATIPSNASATSNLSNSSN